MYWTETPKTSWAVLYSLAACSPIWLFLVIAYTSPYGWPLTALAQLAALSLIWLATMPLASRRVESHELRDHAFELLTSKHPVRRAQGQVLVNIAMDYVRDGVWHQPNEYDWSDALEEGPGPVSGYG